MIVFRIAVAAFAIIMMIFGVAMMIAPTPFGFVLVILGFLLLATAAPAIVRALRKRWRWLDRRLDALTEKAPRWLAKRLKESDPPEDEDDEDKQVEDGGRRAAAR